MGLVFPELSLDLKPSYIPETINGFLREVSMIDDNSERLDRVDDFIKRLEDEIKKIEVFKRELPLCLLLLKDAMSYLKQETTQYKTRNAHQPILEEFIPLKKDSSCENTEMNIVKDEDDSGRDKKNWMSSVQLWIDYLPTKSGAPHISSNQNQNQTQNLVFEAQEGDEKRNLNLGGDLYGACKIKAGSKGFLPLVHNCPSTTSSDVRRKVDKQDVSVPGLTLLVPGMITHPEEEAISRVSNAKLRSVQSFDSSHPTSNGQLSHQQASSRKQRRCWSPELHRRFVDALTQLGGAQVATPKQIRELMRVDGLTNDEVKSHLQKYRLHSKRVTNGVNNENAHGSNGSWPVQDQFSESSKPSSSKSDSPEGPLQFPGHACGTSTTGDDSMEDEDDEKSESYSWKGNLHRPGKDDV